VTGFRHLDDRLVHQGHVWHVVVADYEAPDGATFTRDIVRSPGSVGVVPLVFDAEGQPSVVLVSQYRPTYERDLIEIPAGMRDVPGEPAIDCGRRELAEEAGLDAGQMVMLTEMLPSPGLTDSVCTIFLATDCTAVERQLHGPEEEASEILHIPLVDAIAMVERGEINDAKTVVGLLLTERRIRGG
jgi:ADP-ribose pyrophosphatase